MSEYGLRQQDYETIKALKQEVADLRARLEKADQVIDAVGRIVKEVREARYMVLMPLTTFTAEKKMQAEKRAAINVADKVAAAIAKERKLALPK